MMLNTRSQWLAAKSSLKETSAKMLNTRSQWLVVKSSLKETSANDAKYKKSTKRKGLSQRGHVEL